MINKYHSLEESHVIFEEQLFSFGRKLEKNNLSFEDIGKELPAGLLLNHKNGHNVFMNENSQNILGYTIEEIEGLGIRYNETIMFSQKENKSISLQIKALYKRNDPSEILSFFQRLKPKGKNSYIWMYTSSKLYKRPGQEKPFERILVSCPVNSMGEMANKIHRVLDANIYMRKLFPRYASLTKREKEILKLIVHGHNNPLIAKALFISRRTVEQHRKNINRKLEFDNFAELIKFAEVFDLI